MFTVTNWQKPPTERPLEVQIASLSPSELQAFKELKAYCLQEKKFDFDDALILRLIRCSPGATKFNVVTAKKVAVNFNKWSNRVGLNRLSIRDVRAELERGCLSVPGMCNVDGHLTLYMRPARFFPAKNSLDELMRSLVYLLQCMSESEKVGTVGLSFVANMDNWGWGNWGINYCKNFFDTMQGRYPIRVRRFIILNPPPWFGLIWKMIRNMISAEFAAKISLAKLDEIPALFPSMDHVPTELGGKLDLETASVEFIKYRCKVEGVDYSASYKERSTVVENMMEEN